MASENDKLRALLHEAPNDVTESVALDILRAAGGDLDRARSFLVVPEPAAPTFQSVALTSYTPELIAQQREAMALIEQERRDQELARALANGVSMSQALQPDAERQRQAAEEAERQRQAAAAAEAERQRRAAEAERQRQIEIARQAEEAERARRAAEADRQRQAAAEEAERQRREAEEAERQRQIEIARQAQEAERQRLEAEAERARQAAAEAREAAAREAAAAEQRRLDREAEIARQRAEAEAEIRRQEAEAAARRNQAEAEQRRQMEEAAAATPTTTTTTTSVPPEPEEDESVVVERISANQARYRQEQQRASELASRTEELGRMHQSVRHEIQNAPANADLLQMQQQLADLERQVAEARQAHLEAQREAERERERVDQEVERLRTRSTRPPKVSIFVCSAQSEQPEPISAATNEKIAELRALLLDNAVPNSEIVITDLVNDREQSCFIQQKLGREVAYPVVSILGQPIGDITALRAVIAEDRLTAILAGAPHEPATPLPTQSGPAHQGQGVLDVCLDAVEYIGSTVSGIISTPFWLLSYPFRSHHKCELPKGPNDVDFDVVHTNWYWRNQKRKFRFYDNEFVRIHPTHMDIRATHKYATIQSIRRFDDNTITIAYNDASSPDWLVAAPEDISAIIEVIRRKSKRADLVVMNLGQSS